MPHDSSNSAILETLIQLMFKLQSKFSLGKKQKFRLFQRTVKIKNKATMICLTITSNGWIQTLFLGILKSLNIGISTAPSESTSKMSQKLKNMMSRDFRIL